MTLTKQHLTWYQQQQIPAWGETLQQEHLVSIDTLVNNNGRSAEQLRVDRSAFAKKGMHNHNAIALLKMVRRNIETGAIKLRVYEEEGLQPEKLLTYMQGYTQQDGRLPIYRRWARILHLRNCGYKSTKAWVKYVWKATYL